MGCWLALEPVRSMSGGASSLVDVRLCLFSRADDAWALLDGASDDIVGDTRLVRVEGNATVDYAGSCR